MQPACLNLVNGMGSEQGHRVAPSTYSPAQARPPNADVGARCFGSLALWSLAKNKGIATPQTATLKIRAQFSHVT